MKSLLQFINEQQKNSLLYRGLTQKFDPKYENKVLWLSTSKEHAEMYTKSNSSDAELLTYKVKGNLNPLNLGFRSVETEVKFDEIISRLKQAIMSQFEKGKLSRDEAMNIMKTISSLKPISGYKQVWEWIHIKDILDIIKDSGFNVIQQNEGLIKGKGDIITYGILDKSIVSKL